MVPHRRIHAILFSLIVAAGALRQREVSTAIALARDTEERAGGNATTPVASPFCTLRPPPDPEEEGLNPLGGMRQLTDRGLGTTSKLVMEMPSSGHSSTGIFAVSDAKAAAETIRQRSRHLAQEVFNTTRAYVTLATLCHGGDAGNGRPYFLMYALTLARSLKAVNSSYPLIVLVPDQEDCELLLEYHEQVIKNLNMAFLRVPPHFFNPEALPEPIHIRWRYTYPKSYIWAMDGFERLVYLDSDVMLLRNNDDLFELPDRGHLYMSINQQACNKKPLEANNLGGASNLMVLSPDMSSFNAILGEFKEARRQQLSREGEADDQSIIGQYFKSAGRLKLLSQADMLFTECLLLYNCEADLIRALHFGNVGRMVTSQGGWPVALDLDHRWKPLFQTWARHCRSRSVTEACNGHCKGLCMSTLASWDCVHC
uniref:Hexosyltransferase n=1 Tax=Alexandrium andersonii TaxID=327968 RepID=A0A7S2HWT0_9DINO|mmetsp:Transcript_75860/g.169719  ORF Transcript_75860/g.169719 Transcript_75860/m.169719 type:complete len:427 (+) Transcript_75860:49-1329(+)